MCQAYFFSDFSAGLCGRYLYDVVASGGIDAGGGLSFSFPIVSFRSLSFFPVTLSPYVFLPGGFPSFFLCLRDTHES